MEKYQNLFLAGEINYFNFWSILIIIFVALQILIFLIYFLKKEKLDWSFWTVSILIWTMIIVNIVYVSTHPYQIHTISKENAFLIIKEQKNPDFANCVYSHNNYFVFNKCYLVQQRNQMIDQFKRELNRNGNN